MMGEGQKNLALSSSSSESEEEEEERDELQKLELVGPTWKNKKRLSKQLSMCKTPRDEAWDRRRRQILRRRKVFEESDAGAVELTDEDLIELRGSIELGFGFNEEDGHSLCHTLPALDLYFAVNRQFSSASCSSSSSLDTVSVSTPRGDSPMSEPDSWKIFNPGDNPQQIKTKLRHWAQAVACVVRQSY